ncbi:MAG: SAM-dependent chlorinase/fluorinase, partial [Nanoarchaeota archaeon]|nr:SAM-dependent chlorinase/fluorinase [Nanoarchaeota archaeon]
ITSGKIKKRLRFYKTYADAPDNELFLITGSNNTLEISLKNKKADEKLRLKLGDKIEISRVSKKYLSCL